MRLTQKQFAEKDEELTKLATSIDIYVNTPLSKDKQNTVTALFDELQVKLYEIDCEYLELKLECYRKVYEELKK